MSMTTIANPRTLGPPRKPQPHQPSNTNHTMAINPYPLTPDPPYGRLSASPSRSGAFGSEQARVQERARDRVCIHPDPARQHWSRAGDLVCPIGHQGSRPDRTHCQTSSASSPPAAARCCSTPIWVTPACWPFRTRGSHAAWADLVASSKDERPPPGRVLRLPVSGGAATNAASFGRLEILPQGERDRAGSPLALRFVG